MVARQASAVIELCKRGSVRPIVFIAGGQELLAVATHHIRQSVL